MEILASRQQGDVVQVAGCRTLVDRAAGSGGHPVIVLRNRSKPGIPVHLQIRREVPEPPAVFVRRQFPGAAENIVHDLGRGRARASEQKNGVRSVIAYEGVVDHVEAGCPVGPSEPFRAVGYQV